MRINYDSVRAEAKKLLNVAAECDTSTQVCFKYQNELPLYWEGNAANAYIGGLGQLNRKNQAMAEQLRQLSQQIVAVANDLEETDRRLAAQIAQRQAAAAAAAQKAAADAAAQKAAANAAAKKAAAQAVKKTNTNTAQDIAQKLTSLLYGKR